MKKFASILTASALILALLVGCGGNQAPAGSGSSPAATNTAAGPKTQITFMVIDSFTKNEDDAIFTAEKEFEAANPDIDVVIEPVPATNIKDKFTNAALAGGGPDIVSLDTGGWIVDAAAIGILLDVSDRITPIRDQFQPCLLYTSEPRCTCRTAAAVLTTLPPSPRTVAFVPCHAASSISASAPKIMAAEEAALFSACGRNSVIEAYTTA